MSVQYIASAKLPTKWGQFEIHGFSDSANGKEHIALTMGNLGDGNLGDGNKGDKGRKGDKGATDAPLCRVHSECMTGDSLFSLRCDCGSQLEFAMRRIAEEGKGIILYLRQEGRGIGLLNKIRAYSLQDGGADTVEANVALGFAPDCREYDICRPMFEHFSIKRVRLMTNNKKKVDTLQATGVEVSEIVPIHIKPNPHNEAYLAVKVDKLGHIKPE